MLNFDDIIIRIDDDTVHAATARVMIRTEGQKGERGDEGQAATIRVGSVRTLSPGAPASVTNAGTDQEAVLNFGIPKGDPGAGLPDDGILPIVNGGTGGGGITAALRNFNLIADPTETFHVNNTSLVMAATIVTSQKDVRFVLPVRKLILSSQAATVRAGSTFVIQAADGYSGSNPTQTTLTVVDGTPTQAGECSATATPGYSYGVWGFIVRLIPYAAVAKFNCPAIVRPGDIYIDVA